MKTAWMIVLLELLSFRVTGQQYELNTGWKCIRATSVHSLGEAISKTAFPLTGWIPATVPGTVLTTLLDNKLIPDPFYGMNNKTIPDIYDIGREYYTYWFVKDFDEAKTGDAIFLQFRGVNYSFDAYLNGHKLNKIREKSMYLEHEYDITGYLSKNGHNRLAVIVYPPDSVGNPNGGQGGDGTIAHDITNQFTAGWDWIQPVHDRNTGIWDKVFIKRVKGIKAGKGNSTAWVKIIHPQVISLVPGIRKTGGPQAPAILKVNLEARCGGEMADTGEHAFNIEYEIDGHVVRHKHLAFKPDIYTSVRMTELSIENPRLWWPNGTGPQNLYTLKIRALIGDKVTDEADIAVGVRQLDAVWNSHTQSRELRVNGQKVFLRGGNRILSDEMLRFSKDRYDAEVRYHRDMNLNLIRVWGGGITERPEFYDACDRYGILVMQDFWVSGDCNGRWDDPMKKEDTNARRNYPDDHNLLLRNMQDQVCLLRNHPSLAFWCGGNEIRPPADVLQPFRASLKNLDDTRFFFEYSNDDSMSLQSGDGPYTIQPDSFFWSHRSFPFNSELGSVGIGDYESMERFIPKKDLVPPYYDPATHAWKIDSVWKYHKYIGYDSAIEAYGHPGDAKEFARIARIVNYNQYRALTEGMTSHMWDWYTGFIIWKTQNPWTAMLGQMYDVYLDPNACMYGVMEGCKPIHIMYDPVKDSIIIVNNTLDTVKNLTWGMDDIYVGQIEQRDMITRCDSIYTIPPQTAVVIGSGPKRNLNEVGGMASFNLYNGKNEIDENLYFLPDSSGTYKWLRYMWCEPLVVKSIHKNKGTIAIELSRNKGDHSVAPPFFVHVSLVDKRTKRRIFPVFFSDNYFTVRDSKTICAEYVPQKGVVPMVCVEEWNGNLRYYEIQ